MPPNGLRFVISKLPFRFSCLETFEYSSHHLQLATFPRVSARIASLHGAALSPQAFESSSPIATAGDSCT